MNKLINAFGTSLNSFMKDEEGAQVVEYALIIAVVSIALVLALGGTGTTTLSGSFTTLINRVKSCFTNGACTATL